LPHDSQKCAARMSPHDQQECVSAGNGWAPIMVRDGGIESGVLNQAENEVPQPHDFVAWGFTKTKPCCISVSW
jgi:hypothetical protein